MPPAACVIAPISLPSSAPELRARLLPAVFTTAAFAATISHAAATWGQAVQRIPAGETSFGTPINLFEAPFLHGVTIVEAPLLRPYTAIALTSAEIYVRNKRNPYWNLRGNRGDMVEGDWLAEMAIEVVNESHHAWVEGITAFSAN